MSKYICPYCNSEIDAVDVNVATDIALCRQCGKTTSFSQLSRLGNLDLDLNDPPKYVKLGTDYLEPVTKIVYKKIPLIVLFIVPFTAVWAGVSTSGIYGSQILNGKFDPVASLFGIPFLIGSIVLVSVCLFMLFGKVVIKLDHGEGSVFMGAGRLGWTRRFTYSRGSMATLKMTNVRVNNVSQEGICINTDGQGNFVFGTMLEQQSKEYIAAYLTREFRKK